jgi:hypothetical protein
MIQSHSERDYVDKFLMPTPAVIHSADVAITVVQSSVSRTVKFSGLNL